MISIQIQTKKGLPVVAVRVHCILAQERQGKGNGGTALAALPSASFTAMVIYSSSAPPAPPKRRVGALIISYASSAEAVRQFLLPPQYGKFMPEATKTGSRTANGGNGLKCFAALQR